MNVCIGGTDIISCFAGQNPMLPVYQGEIQARNLGMAVECWNYDGEQCYDIVLCHCFYKLYASIQVKRYLMKVVN